MRTFRGFTLIEIMIAVAIIGILVAVAVPLYRGYIETGQQQALLARSDGLRIFQENWRVDNGSYFAGTYTSGGANGFAAIGYVVQNDQDGITLTVTACDGDAIANCFKLIATDEAGHSLVWQGGTYTWQ